MMNIALRKAPSGKSPHDLRSNLLYAVAEMQEVDFNGEVHTKMCNEVAQCLEPGVWAVDTVKSDTYRGANYQDINGIAI